jgi:hypothetical protein
MTIVPGTTLTGLYAGWVSEILFNEPDQQLTWVIDRIMFMVWLVLVLSQNSLKSFLIPLHLQLTCTRGRCRPDKLQIIPTADLPQCP